MKLRLFGTLIAIMALLGGCTNVPPQGSARISAAFHAYLAIEKGATHSQVVALLGSEAHRDEDGAYLWETRYDTLNYAFIRIHFDSRDRVREIELSRGWGALNSGLQAKAVIDYEK